jgi:tight adherence protein C
MSQANEIFILAFASITALIYFVFTFLFKGEGGDKLRSRLQGKTKAEVVKKEGGGGFGSVFKQLGEFAARPFMPATREKQSTLQRELARAGVYSPSAMRTVQGSKVIGIALGLIIGYILGWWFDAMFMCLAILGLAGYVVPIIWLRLKVKGNQKAL